MAHGVGWIRRPLEKYSLGLLDEEYDSKIGVHLSPGHFESLSQTDAEIYRGQPITRDAIMSVEAMMA